MKRWFQRPDRPERPVLDCTYLQRLANHIGERETRELMADGMLELSDKLKALEALADSDDYEAIADLAHEIAGAAGHQGLAALSSAAVGANRMARQDTPPAAEEVVRTVLEYRAVSLKALSAYCAGADPAGWTEKP